MNSFHENKKITTHKYLQISRYFHNFAVGYLVGRHDQRDKHTKF